MPKVIDRTAFINAARTTFGDDVNLLSRQQVLKLVSDYSLPFPNWLTNSKLNRAGRGEYKLFPEKTVRIVGNMSENKERPKVIPDANPETSEFVPVKVDNYVPFGHFDDVLNIIKSEKFFPTFITGLSGNGKTMMIEQAAATAGRECIRVNITRETDEDDLIGGFRLVDGETVWSDGPVIVAMKRGALLLLDEVDLGDAKLMCLQPILEGKPFFIKKIKSRVIPKTGFNVFATANTKGRGSDDGKFIGTNIMNEAFLERFSITFEQEYPAESIEMVILTNILGKNYSKFIAALVNWAGVIRKSFTEGASNEIISTRRLVHICEAYLIFGDNKMKAITTCLNRFDASTRDDFIKTYKKIDIDATGSGIDPVGNNTTKGRAKTAGDFDGTFPDGKSKERYSF